MCRGRGPDGSTWLRRAKQAWRAEAGERQGGSPGSGARASTDSAPGPPRFGQGRLDHQGNLTAAMLPLIPTRMRRPARGIGQGDQAIKALPVSSSKVPVDQVDVGAGQFGGESQAPSSDASLQASKRGWIVIVIEPLSHLCGGSLIEAASRSRVIELRRWLARLESGKRGVGRHGAGAWNSPKVMNEGTSSYSIASEIERPPGQRG